MRQRIQFGLDPRRRRCRLEVSLAISDCPPTARSVGDRGREKGGDRLVGIVIEVCDKLVLQCPRDVLERVGKRKAEV